MLHHKTIGSGPPVLLLPGMLGTIESELERFMQPIADLGYTAITADFPGHGQSEMAKSFTVRVLTEEIERLLSGLHLDPAVIFGYSLGGYAALNFALKHPLRVVGVWMHATKFYWSGQEAEDLAAEMDLAYLEEQKPDYLAKLHDRHTAENLEALMPWLNKMIAALPDTGLTEFDLEELKLPVMVSVGDRDEMIPASEAVDLYQALPHGQLTVFPDTNHPLDSLRDHVLLPVFKDFLNRLD